MVQDTLPPLDKRPECVRSTHERLPRLKKAEEASRFQPDLSGRQIQLADLRPAAATDLRGLAGAGTEAAGFSAIATSVA